MLGAILSANTRANSEACSEIPYSTKQGIFAKEQGICTREQGNLRENRKFERAKEQRDFRMIFSEGTGWATTLVTMKSATASLGCGANGARHRAPLQCNTLNQRLFVVLA